jgi:amino acid transporter
VWDVVFLNLSTLAVGLSIAVGPSWGARLWPGSNVAISVIVAGVLSISTGLVYAMLSAAMPRSGGDYVWTSRVLHPAVGFATNFAQFATWLILSGLFSFLIVALGITPLLVSTGVLTGNQGLVELGNNLSTPTFFFWFGVVVIALNVLLNILGGNVIRWLYRIVVIPAFVIQVVLWIVMLTISQSGFAEAFNAFYSAVGGPSGGYQQIIDIGREVGATIPSSLRLGASLLAVPLGVNLFLGFTYSVHIGGEVKQPRRSQLIGILGVLALTTVVMALSVQAFYNMVGIKFLHAMSYVFAQAPDQLAFAVEPTVPFLVGIGSRSVAVNVLGQLGLVFWVFLLLVSFIVASIRVTFAYSFDRLLPEALTQVNRFGVPWVSAVAVGVVSVVTLYLFVFTEFFTLILNTMAIQMLVFAVVGVVAALFPSRLTAIYEAAPAFVRRRVLGVPLISIAGIVHALFSLAIFLVIYFSPAFATFVGPTGLQANLFMIGLFAVGFVYYFIARAVRKSQGIDLDLLWKELPPD